jgi:heme exporter protein B
VTDLPRVLRAFLWKDLLRETRTGETVLAVAALGFLIVLVLAFALPAASESDHSRAAGALWIALIFSCQLGIARGIEQERSQGRLETILATRVDGGTLYAVKALSLFAHLALSSLLLLPPLGVLFNLSLRPVVGLLPILGVGLAGLALAGTLIALLTAATRLREILMPLLFLTIFTPLLLAAVEASDRVLAGEPAGVALHLLVAFDLIIGGVAFLLAPAIFDE